MMTTRQRVTVLGATGSIGQSTLNVIGQHPDRFTVFALSGHANMAQLALDIIRFKPQFAVVPNDTRYRQLLELLPNRNCDILIGEQALADVASAAQVDTVMAAIVGAAGLKSALAAAHAGKKLLLANKESMVVAGALLMEAVAKSQALLLPIDSEHNAIFQCLPADQSQAGVDSILLTASGGPFRQTPMEQLLTATPEQAIAHPTWTMGRKISVDSASLMNKGLELIEACWLFNVPPEKIEVVVHPQSVIHSMVRYIDGSVLAQMGSPDMRTPISYGLAYPDRIVSGSAPLEFSQLLQLQFDQPDRVRFPCLRLAEEAMAEGGTVPAVLNAANEMSVAAFLEGDIGFMDIPRINEQVMTRLGRSPVESIDQLLEVDRAARAQAAEQIKALR